MFTGIIEELGRIRSLTPLRHSGSLIIRARKVLEGTRIGDSIAVNGICLTVHRHDPGQLYRGCDGGDRPQKQPEKLPARRSRQPGAGHGGRRPFRRPYRLRPHRRHRLRPFPAREENAVWITVETPPELMGLIVEKGSICMDGVSLTVAGTRPAEFQVSVIPHTGAETTLLQKKPGDPVNLETDLIGKYVQKLLGAAPDRNGKAPSSALQTGGAAGNAAAAGASAGNAPERAPGTGRGASPSGGITMDFLRECGF